MLAAVGLTKEYQPGIRALDDLTLAVANGELFALLGANGAGKTTAINCLLDFTRPTAGHATVDDIVVADDPIAAKRRLAYLPESVALYDALSGSQNYRFFVELAGNPCPTADDALAALLAVGLPPSAPPRPAAQYSKGMRQKVGLAIAFARGTRNLVLDEPTSGLDPAAAADLMALLAAARDRGCSVLMSTHDVFRTHGAADRVGIMRQGRLLRVLEQAEIANANLEAIYHDCMRTDASRHRSPSSPA